MERILLIRDASELSTKAEEFLKEKNYQYDIFYGDEREQLPAIFAPNCSHPYIGERGFNYFKALRNISSRV